MDSFLLSITFAPLKVEGQNGELLKHFSGTAVFQADNFSTI
jgi:hypothetical protein